MGFKQIQSSSPSVFFFLDFFGRVTRVRGQSKKKWRKSSGQVHANHRRDVTPLCPSELANRLTREKKKIKLRTEGGQKNQHGGPLASAPEKRRITWNWPPQLSSFLGASVFHRNAACCGWGICSAGSGGGLKPAGTTAQPAVRARQLEMLIQKGV